MKRTQSGFTLIELALVGLFLSLLTIFVISQFSESATDNVKGKGLFEAANKITENWALLSMQCGTPIDIGVSPIGDATTPTAAENLTVILGGANPIAAYTACYGRSGIKPLFGLAQGAAGGESINGYAVTAAMDGTNPRRLVISFAGVPDNVLLPIYNRYSSVAGAAAATTVPAAADTTDPQIRFSVAASGVRTVSIVKAL